MGRCAGQETRPRSPPGTGEEVEADQLDAGISDGRVELLYLSIAA